MSVKKTAAGVLIGALAWVPGCSVFGVRDTPEPEYTVERQIEGQNIEVRAYAPMIVAVTRVEAKNYDRASSIGFRRLANYIFGENARKENIGMTAPVYQRADRGEGENIGMTSPVLREQDDQGRWVMSFVMPDRYTMETIPKPLTSEVELEQVPARRVAVIRFNGTLSSAQYEEKSRELRSWISRNDYHALSEPRMAGYDPPLTIPFFRRNEVLIEVASQPVPVAKEPIVQ